MNHNRWWCNIVWRYGCPACKVRQLQQGYRLDPQGFHDEIREIRNGRLFTKTEKRWILEKIGRW